MSVAIIIQAHPARAALAEQLARLVAADTIAWDPDPRAAASPWRAYRRALTLGLDTFHDHVLVMQDDAEPVAGFRSLAERACALRPLNPIAFYVGPQNPQNAIAIHIAHQEGRGWCELQPSDWIPVVATAWPRSIAADLLGFGLERYRDPVADDMVAGRFATHRRMSTLAVVPSPVDHGNAPSLLGSSLERRAVLAAASAADCPLEAI